MDTRDKTNVIIRGILNAMYNAALYRDHFGGSETHSVINFMYLAPSDSGPPPPPVILSYKNKAKVTQSVCVCGRREVKYRAESWDSAGCGLFN